MAVLEIFFREPTIIHFIRGTGKEIGLAQTSVRNNIKELMKLGLIKRKKSKPFDGFVANRDNEQFLFYKRVYNLYSLYELKKFIDEEIHPKTTIIFGSYSVGEDIESSDIDILIVSRIKKEIETEKFEKCLKRKIHIITVDDVKKLDKNMQKRVMNGVIITGGL